MEYSVEEFKRIFKLAEEIICEPENSAVCYPSWVTEKKNKKNWTELRDQWDSINGMGLPDRAERKKKKEQEKCLKKQWPKLPYG